MDARELEAIERAGWDALSGGDPADYYGRVMTDDGLMVLANGMVMDRGQVVDALSQSPPWASYELDDVRVVQIGEDSAALVYRGTARRDGDGPPVVAAMTSVYVRQDGECRLALYTQTPIPG
jgi:hypothetical protein